jgi:hypothetical protein
LEKRREQFRLYCSRRQLIDHSSFTWALSG